MDYIEIEGLKPYDGRYEFDLEGRPFTTREWGWIKRYAGYMPLTIADGWRERDPELYATFAIVALWRAYRLVAEDVADVFDRIADAPFGSTIRLELEPAEEGDDADPPDQKTSGSEPFNGHASTETSDRSELPPNRFGATGSDTSESVPAKLGT